MVFFDTKYSRQIFQFDLYFEETRVSIRNEIRNPYYLRNIACHAFVNGNCCFYFAYIGTWPICYYLTIFLFICVIIVIQFRYHSVLYVYNSVFFSLSLSLTEE